MTKPLATCLGCPSSVLLDDQPFNLWPVEKSIENDLEEPLIHYIFLGYGLELRCDRDDKISVIFLHADQFNGFIDGLIDIDFSFTRQQVQECLGSPSKSGQPTSHPILGRFGVWDRFSRPEYTIHVQFEVDADRIKQITLMKPGAVP